MAKPEYPNDRSLLSSIFICADEEAYERARDLLPMFSLKPAEEGEYFSGPNVDRLYLNTHGLCLSFVYRRPNPLRQAFAGITQSDFVTAPVFEARKLIDDRILQPLLQIDLSPNCCLEIVPGVERVGVGRGDLYAMAKNLRSDGINFYSRAPEFVGLIRDKTEPEPRQLIINRRAVKTFAPVVASDTERSALFQQSVYGGLRDEFLTAFAKASAGAMAAVMEECVTIAALSPSDEAKILHAHWKEAAPATERRRAIRDAANAYQSRLAAA
jgi:hypothetical protein